MCHIPLFYANHSFLCSPLPLFIKIYIFLYCSRVSISIYYQSKQLATKVSLIYIKLKIFKLLKLNQKCISSNTQFKSMIKNILIAEFMTINIASGFSNICTSKLFNNSFFRY